MVNTFLVDEDFRISAGKLDKRRLLKQIVEAKQILDVLEKLEALGDTPGPDLSWEDKKAWRSEAIAKGPRIGWASHPAVLMWVGCREALIYYYNCHLREFVRRGGKPVKLQKIPLKSKIVAFPAWSVDPRFHKNHRGALLKKELDRNEPPHYQLMEEFLRAPPFDDYLWEL